MPDPENMDVAVLKFRCNLVYELRQVIIVTVMGHVLSFCLFFLFFLSSFLPPFLSIFLHLFLASFVIGNPGQEKRVVFTSRIFVGWYGNTGLYSKSLSSFSR